MLLRLIAAAAFIAVPIAEIAVFIQVGDLIGLWPTLACIVATAILGVSLLRLQGLSVVAQASQALDEGRLPVEPIIHGAFLLVAGALLLTPGFITDAVGFALLVPPLRVALARAIWSALRRSGDVHVVVEGDFRESEPGPRRGEGPVIEGEAVEREEEENGAGRADSPWRRGGAGPENDGGGRG